MDPRSYRMLWVCEAYAEGLIDLDALIQADREAFTVGREYEQSTVEGEVRLASDAAKWLGPDEYKLGRAAEFANELFGFRAIVAAGVTEPKMTGFEAVQHWQHPVFLAAQQAEESVQADILRDLFANPFRIIELDPEWRTSTVMALAQTVYADQNYELLPILADALQDAGCRNGDILDHCRDPRLTHFKGCWVVDLFTGRC